MRAFDDFLAADGDHPQRNWIKNEDDPPDCWLCLGTCRYAVEATSTKVQVGDKPAASGVEREKFLLGCQDLCDTIGVLARGKGILRGFYGISFDPSGAVGGGAFGELKKCVVKAALAYVGKHKSASSAPPRSVLFDRREICRIAKYGDARDEVAFLSMEFGYTGDIVRSIKDHLGQALVEKAQKLADKNVQRPWVLLLLNTDGFAEKRDDLYRRVGDDLSTMGSFHSVFVVWGDGTGFMLRSDNPRWGRMKPPDRT